MYSVKSSIWFLLFFISLVTENNLQAKTLLSSLVSTESDPDAFIENCVNVINGDYCEAATDLVVKGPDLLLLQRFYNAKDYVTGKQDGGWRIFPQRFLVIGKDPNVKPRTIGKETFHWAMAFTGERSGGILPYCGWRSSLGSTKDPLEIDIFENAKGIVNTYSKEISGRCNHRNNLLHGKTDTCELNLGDGSKRIFKRVDHLPSSILGEELVPHLASLVEEPEYYLLTQETLPSGNHICFTYDAEGHLSNVELKNHSQQKTLSWMQFQYEFQENKRKVTVTSSDEKRVEYHYSNHLEHVNGSHLIPASYEYFSSRLTKKILPEGRFLEIEYENSGKVSILKKPNASTGTPEAVYAFSYGDGYTEVFNALGIKTHYTFDKRDQLSAIEKYDEQAKLYRKDRKIWGKTKNEVGLLLAKAIEDGSSRVHSYHEYKYDERGNVIEERLYGNLTGKDEVAFDIDSDGKIVNPDKAECHVKTFDYSKDGFNLLTQIGDPKGNKTVFFYKPGTNLLVKKFIYDQSTIKKRIFHTYDDNAVIIKTVEDDGSQSEEAKASGYGVSERHITVYKPKESAPGLGLTEVLEERGLDLKQNKEYLIKKVVNDYDPQGNLIASHLHDSNGTYRCSEKRSYNNLGQISSTTDAMGKECLYVYDPLGNKILETIPHENRTIAYTYDFRNQLIEIREQAPDLELVSSFTYDLLGRKTSSTDYFGNTTHYEYDSFGRLIKVTHPEVLDEFQKVISPAFTYTYDIFGNVIHLLDPKGYSTYKTYNLRGDVTKISYPDGTCELFKYDLEGSLHRALARNQLVTVYEYDYLGRCHNEESSNMAVKGRSSVLHSRKQSYNAFRLLSREFERHKETFRFDSAGRMIAAVTHETRDSEHSTKTRLTEFSYDSIGRVFQKKIWFGEGSQDFTLEYFDRDFAGNILEKRIGDAQGKVLFRKAFSYDLSDRCIEERGFDQGNAVLLTKTDYNSQGQLTSTQDALGHETKVLIDYSYRNSLGQNVLKTTYIDALGVETEIEYDALSRIVKTGKKDSKGTLLASEEVFYDSLGNKCVEIHQVVSNGMATGSKILQWVYGPMGRLEEEVEALGTPEEKKTVYSYNSLGQMSSMKVMGTPSPVTYSYDNGGNLIKMEYSEGKLQKILNTYSYDKNGNITSARCLNDIAVERTYNAFHQPLSETISDGEGKYTVNYEYDRKGRLKAITLPDKSKITYHFDALFGRKVERLSSTGQAFYSHTYEEYDEQGRLLSETLIGYLGNQLHAYDVSGQRVFSKNDFLVENYSYDPVGRLTEIDKAGIKTSFSYNNLSQLASEDTLKSKTYGYNSLDDRIDCDESKYSYNARNQLLESPKGSFSYDPQGNLLRKTLDAQESHFEFSVLSQLTSYKKTNSSCSFIYDAFGRLLAKKKFISQDKQAKPIATTRYLNLGYLEIGTLAKNGNIETLKVPGLDGEELDLKSVAFEISGVLFAPLHSISGNTVAVLDPRKIEVLERYSYSAFGEETIYNSSGEIEATSSLGIPWRFAEKRRDNDTGLIHFGLRYYDSSMGRWISPDPIGFNDGPNTYAYIHNNPLRYHDRYGLATEDKSSGINLNYLYGELETIYHSEVQCVCQEHRTCKRGGNLSKSDSPGLPKITYIDYFEDMMAQLDPGAARSSVYDLSDEGLPELPPDMQIGFVNGIMNTMNDAKETARYISALAGGYNVHAVYNATHGLKWDLHECDLGLNFKATEPVRQLHKMWNSFFEKSSKNAKFMMICHSQGAIHVRNALIDYPPELRESILVVAIAPGGYIYQETCAEVVHYRAPFYRDFVPLLDRRGKMREAKTTFELASHPDAEIWDHGILSLTYKRELRRRILNFIKSNGAHL